MTIISKIKLNDMAINQVKLNDIAVTQIEINNNIVYQIDKTNLNNILESYYQTYAAGQTSGLAGGPYTTATWTPFAEAYAAALQIRNSKYSNEETVSNAITNLDGRYNELEKARTTIEVYSSPENHDFISIGRLRAESNWVFGNYIVRDSLYTTTMGPFPKSGMINVGIWDPGIQREYNRGCLTYNVPNIAKSIEKVTMVFNLTDSVSWNARATNAKLYAVIDDFGIFPPNESQGGKDSPQAKCYNIAKGSHITLDSSITEYDVTKLYKESVASATKPSFIIISSIDEGSTSSQCFSVYAPKLVITFIQY